MRYRASDAGAKAMGISVLPLGARELDDFQGAFKAMNDDMPDAILMVSDSLTTLNRKQVFEYAAEHRLPVIYEFDSFARDGGLMSYGPDLDETFERVYAPIEKPQRACICGHGALGSRTTAERSPRGLRSTCRQYPTVQ